MFSCALRDFDQVFLCWSFPGAWSVVQLAAVALAARHMISLWRLMTQSRGRQRHSHRRIMSRQPTIASLGSAPTDRHSLCPSVRLFTWSVYSRPWPGEAPWAPPPTTGARRPSFPRLAPRVARQPVRHEPWRLPFPSASVLIRQSPPLAAANEKMTPSRPSAPRLLLLLLQMLMIKFGRFKPVTERGTFFVRANELALRLPDDAFYSRPITAIITSTLPRVSPTITALIFCTDSMYFNSMTTFSWSM